MEIACPGCGKRGRLSNPRPGMSLACPGCGRKWTLDAPRRASRPSPSRAAASEADDETTLEPSPAPDVDRDAARLRRWTLLAGVLLLVGLLLPFVGVTSADGGGRKLEAAGVWDAWDYLEGDAKTRLFVLAGVAIGLLAVSAMKTSPAKAIAVIALAAVALGVQVGPDAMGDVAVPRTPVLLVLAAVAAVALAAANRLWKLGGVRWASLAAVAAAVVGAVLLFIPPSEVGEALGSTPFAENAWTFAPALAGAVVVLLLYFASGLLHLVPSRAAAAWISVVGRAAAVALPLAFAVGPWIEGRSDDPALDGVVSASRVLKPVLLLYPPLIALGTAAVVLLARRRAVAVVHETEVAKRVRVSAAPAAPEPRAAATPTTVAVAAASVPDAPPPRVERTTASSETDLASLRARLARLQTAKEEGLISAEEYEAKRKAIVERFDF